MSFRLHNPCQVLNFGKWYFWYQICNLLYSWVNDYFSCLQWPDVSSAGLWSQSPTTHGSVALFCAQLQCSESILCWQVSYFLLTIRYRFTIHYHWYGLVLAYNRGPTGTLSPSHRKSCCHVYVHGVRCNDMYCSPTCLLLLHNGIMNVATSRVADRIMASVDSSRQARSTRTHCTAPSSYCCTVFVCHSAWSRQFAAILDKIASLGLRALRDPLLHSDKKIILIIIT